MDRHKAGGITFDCGLTRELGQDPVEVCRYFGKKDCINHMHFRWVFNVAYARAMLQATMEST